AHLAEEGARLEGRDHQLLPLGRQPVDLHPTALENEEYFGGLARGVDHPALLTGEHGRDVRDPVDLLGGQVTEDVDRAEVADLLRQPRPGGAWVGLETSQCGRGPGGLRFGCADLGASAQHAPQRQPRHHALSSTSQAPLSTAGIREVRRSTSACSSEGVSVCSPGYIPGGHLLSAFVSPPTDGPGQVAYSLRSLYGRIAMRLEVFLAAHCITCDEAVRLVEHVRRDFPTVEVRVHDLDADPQARRPEVFAVPTYVLDGRVLSIGNPDERTLAAALSADGTARGEPRARSRAWPFPHAAAMVGGALAVLSCGGPLAALAVVALQHVLAFPAPPAGLVAVGRSLASIADPTWALRPLLLLVWLARRGLC